MDERDNLRVDLERLETRFGEKIEAMVVGKHDKAPWEAEPGSDENVVLSREDGLAKVNQDYDAGLGGADCYPLWAWTASRVFFVHEYDGATRINWVPRHPVAGAPEFGGNGE